MHEYTQCALIAMKNTEQPDRREQRRLKTQAQLLDAAEKVFSERGYGTTSILDITEAANLSKRTFYLHFSDKTALIEAIAQRHFVRIHQIIMEAESKIDSNRERLHYTMLTIFEYAESEPNLMQALFGLDASHKLNAMAREYIARAMETDFANYCEFKPDAPVPSIILAQAYTGVIYQFLCWWVRNPNRYSPHEMADMAESVLIDGIGINFKVPPEEVMQNLATK